MMTKIYKNFFFRTFCILKNIHPEVSSISIFFKLIFLAIREPVYRKKYFAKYNFTPRPDQKEMPDPEVILVIEAKLFKK